jgi:hypothetical protein
MAYIVISGASSHPTLTLSGTNLIVNASSTTDQTTTTSTKQISVTMQGNSAVTAKTHTISMKVYPCIITALSVSNMTSGIGDRKT